MLTIVSLAPPDLDPHPRFEDYASCAEYERAFHLWRARQRDGRLNSEELAAQWEVIEAFVRSRSQRG